MSIALIETSRPTTSTVLDHVETQWPGDLRLLLGPDAVDVVAEFFGRSGGVLAGPVRATQVAHRPKRSTTVTYRTEVEWSCGSRTHETVVATTGEPTPDGATALTNGSTGVAVWRWPDDPLLPGLSSALDPHAIATMFDRLGIGGDPCALRVRAYRPGRRAVVEAHNARGRVFLKVVRPDRVRALHDLHRDLTEHLPVPNSIGWSDDGILVMPAVPGVTLRRALQSPTGAVPAPASIDALLDALPPHLAAGTPRRHWLDLARHHARVIRSTVPAVASQVDDLVERLADHEASHRRVDHEIVAIHGDLYEAQVIVDDGDVVGLLDVDTVGAGHRIDDLANFCAHLSVLAVVTPSARRIRNYGTALLAFAETRFDRSDFRARVAAATLGLATGSFRVLEPNWVANTSRRIALGDEWLTTAAR